MTRELERLLNHLNAEEQRVIVLTFLAEDVTPRQAARQLGVSEGELDRMARSAFAKLQRVAKEAAGGAK